MSDNTLIRLTVGAQLLFVVGLLAFCVPLSGPVAQGETQQDGGAR